MVSIRTYPKHLAISKFILLVQLEIKDKKNPTITHTMADEARKTVSLKTITNRMERILIEYETRINAHPDVTEEDELDAVLANFQSPYSTEKGLENQREILDFAVEGERNGDINQNDRASNEPTNQSRQRTTRSKKASRLDKSSNGAQRTGTSSEREPGRDRKKDGHKSTTAKDGQKSTNKKDGQKASKSDEGQKPSTTKDGPKPSTAKDGQKPSMAKDGQKATTTKGGQKVATKDGPAKSGDKSTAPETNVGRKSRRQNRAANRSNSSQKA